MKTRIPETRRFTGTLHQAARQRHQGVPRQGGTDWVANTVTLIWGERDALLVDTFSATRKQKSWPTG